MKTPLPSALELITSSWSLFTKSWNDLVQISLWFIFFGLAHFALAMLRTFAPAAETILFFPVFVLTLVLETWVGIRLIRAVLAVDAGEKPDMSHTEQMHAWRLWLPLMLTGMLQGLITLGGLVLFVLPGLFFAVALSFSQFFVIDQDLRGLKAISASYQLVKGRWWATLWRILATGFVFGLCVAIAIGVLAAIFAALTGSNAFRQNPDPLLSGTFVLFQSIIQAAIIPLVVIVQVKIYRALERSRQ